MAGPDKVPVVHQEDLGAGVYYLVLEAPAAAAAAVPGQFLHVRVGEGYDPLLRRPFSLHEVDRLSGTVGLLYKVRGRGTAWLSARRPGDLLDVLGPLGSGFPPPPGTGSCVLVGGGLGTAPLFFLAAELRRKGWKIVFLAGAASAAGLYRLEVLETLGLELAVATEDGSRGYRGLVTELLAAYLRQRGAPAALYACGPWEMLCRAAKLGKDHGIPTFVSLEQIMGCGTGLCLGCAVPVRGGYARACTEGPVMPAEKVVWDGV